jgi:nucleoside-diphosphate-sugar epimerase
MSILVTGASGTVGSVVAEQLGARGMVRRDPAPGQVLGDLTDPASLRAAVDGVDTVVHCAASLSKEWDDCERGNVDGTRNLVAAMRAAGCRRLVHISTVSVYDYRTGVPLTEDAPMWTEKNDAYGYTKAVAERLVVDGGISFVILRPVVILSMHPRSYWGPLAIERARASDAPVWPLATLPHVHVDSLAAAIRLAVDGDAGLGRAYNVMDGSADGDVFNARVARAAGRTTPPAPATPFTLPLDAARIQRELGFTPTDRFAEMLAAFVPAA